MGDSETEVEDGGGGIAPPELGVEQIGTQRMRI